ncbi:FtsK/SpoIIIE family DNA translocase [Eisenbergiella tayi]|uniref:FtsK/SpoIIIE family DNA translocase n=1 Tax=Eisenbergiella tayi TaxID=1432052 RepID=UPI000848AFDB|nr:DNA translocase FtsK [Eisenbergiella tayi]ODR35195.1 cell division protein FtsK [Eisenbergiella tayi]
MASTSGSRSGAGKKNTSSSSRTRSSSNNKSKTSKTNSKSRSQQTIRTEEESAITNEIILIGVFALSILLFLCNFGIIGPVGNAVSHVMFGIFGMMAYVVPVLIFLGIAFGISNKGNMFAAFKIAAAVLLILLIGVVLELIGGQVPSMEKYSVELLYTVSADSKAGGGVLAGSLAYLLNHFMGMVGAVLLVIVLAIICLVVITEKSFVSGVRVGGRKVYESAREETRVRKERAQKRKEELEARREEEYRLREEEKARKDAEKILRMDKRVSGVMIDTTLAGQSGGQAEELPARTRNDIHEITVEDLAAEKKEAVKVAPKADNIIDFDRIQIHTASQMTLEENDKFGEGMPAETAPEPDPLAQTYRDSDVFSDMKEVSPIHITVKPAGEARSTIFDAPLPDKEKPAGGELYDQVPEQEILPWEEPDSGEPLLQEAMAPAAGMERPKASLPEGRDRFAGGKAPGVYDTGKPAGQAAMDEMRKEGAAAVIHTEAPKKERPYHFPPLSLLQKPGSKNTGDGVKELKNTAAKLQQTLATFGVKVTITDISQGPSVTRYELQPEQGVKVSKILGLADDIKLNLAAMDIRIEAPIPGKAAIGIEVPNKENTMVALRELMESKEFRDFPSKLSFAVGKDIGGKVVVSDIAKMPHMLIAGSTGSGKSVCINTLIMSILYKARPDEVKLILVDPKVVELSVYNGIPHLLIPVVTDPKQASAALHWGVAEMTDRYQKFADHNVRDLKGYNKKVEEQRAKGDPTAPDKLPQIVIIVDELADLMMVSPGEVEESICRLAQLARAAGIHLIIATQRPSVDVITGLIKANMPSRVAFAVSSGVDSRTILDMNGAEKLLGKGDMLFYPQGYSKPARIQGAFVSDGEVSDVVDFLKNQVIGNVYDDQIVEKVKTMESAGGGTGGASGGGGPERDAYFEEAGKFIIDKDKASIGMLQRVFKIGFNRAARIMDQLAEAGVVGEEEGTKPRKVLMSPEQFEQYIEESL